MQNTFGPHLQNLMITSQNSSPAVPRSITECFVTQNIGEVARSDGGVENDINQFISDISLSFCRVLWHYGELQNSIGIKGYFSILSPCVSVREYRGSARRARGLERWHIVFL